MIAKYKDGEKDLPLSQITAENYIADENNKNKVVVKIEKISYNQSTGEKTSTPRLQYFDDAVWKRGMLKQLQTLGYEVTILFEPQKKEKNANKRNN